MHHHTGNTGHVRNGNYGLITVTTRTTFADDVRFRTTMVTGTLEANTITGNQLIVDNGTVRCSGDVHVERIAGRGRIITDGSIICGGIELTGDLHSGGDITCNDDLLVKGSLTSRHIRAQHSAPRRASGASHQRQQSGDPAIAQRDVHQIRHAEI